MGAKSLVAAVLVSALGCGCTSAATIPLESPPVATEAHPAEGIAAARMLPRDTRALLFTGDVDRLFVRAGRELVTGHLRAEHERLRFGLIAELGVDATDPFELSRIGVDTRGQVAVAFDGDGLVVCFELADQRRFRNELYRIAANAPGEPPEVIGDALLVSAHHFAAVLRGEQALIFFGDAANRRAQRAAALDPRLTLAQSSAFRATMSALHDSTKGAAGELTAYVDVRALTFAEHGLDPMAAGRDRKEALASLEQEHRRALSAARARGASAEEIVALDEAHRRALDRVGSASDERVRALAGGIEGFGVTLRLRDDGVELAGVLAAAEGSLPVRAWRNAVAHRAPPAGTIRLGASLDPTALQELFTAYGADELAAFLPALSGELEASITTYRGAAPTDRDEVVATVAFGLTDPAAMRALFGSAEGQGKSFRWQGVGWTARIDGDRLVVSTSPTAPAPSHAGHGTSALDLEADATAILWPFFAAPRSLPRVSIQQLAEESGQEGQAEPHPDAEALGEELARIERDIHKLERDLERRRQDLTIAALRALGRANLRVARAADTLELSLRLTTASAHPARAVVDLIEVLVAEERDPQLRSASRRLADLENRRWEIERQLFR